jgi:hypothetical protein
VVLLIGQPAPFLGHFQQRRTVLPGREALGHETAITRNPPILFRSTRHNRRRPSNRKLDCPTKRSSDAAVASAKADRPARQHQGPEVVGKSVRASSIRAIAIMTNAVETNRILGSPPNWCVIAPWASA